MDRTKTYLKYGVYVASFWGPLLSLLITAWLAGIWPFGTTTSLSWDASSQYIDFMTYLRDLLRGDSKELFYSFAQALGADNAGLFGYYLLSPYNLLLLFSSDYNVPYWFEIIQAFKIASCGLTMCIFLKHKSKYNRRSNNDVLIIILSILYAMSGFNASQIMNVMWLDGAVLLPLVSLAILRIIYDDSLWAFYITILLSLISCFYTGYMIVIYSVAFFALEIVKVVKNDNNKYSSHYAKILINFFMTLITAAGSSATFMLPIYYDLKLSKLENADELQISYVKFGEAVLWYLLFNIILYLIWGVFRKRYSGRFSRLLSGGMTVVHIGISWEVMNYIANKGIYDKDVISTPLKLLIGTFNFTELRDGLPNIFIGTIGAIFLIMIVLSSKGSNKEAVSCSSWLTLVGIFSVIGFIPINMLFHGGTIPAGSNYRWSFILSFVLLLFISEHLEKVKDIRCDFYGIIGAFIIIGILIVSIHIYMQSNMDFLNTKTIILSGVFIGIYLLLLLGLRIMKPKKIIRVLLILTICVEMSLNLCISQQDFDNMKKSDYTDVVDMSKQMSSIIDSQMDSKAVYRAEMITTNRWDYVWRQNGISSYSSVLPSRNVSFLEQFGMKSMAMYNKATCNNPNLDSKLASLLGIHYILSGNELDKAQWVPIGDVTGNEGVFTLYRNRDALPMCFIIDRNNTYTDINDVANDFDEIRNKFENQDSNLVVSDISEYSIDVNIDGDSKLIFMIPYTDGWIVKVDGTKTDYYKECDFYMGIDISSGTHNIVIQYVPPLLNIGLIISAICVLAFVLYAIYSKKVIRVARS